MSSPIPSSVALFWDLSVRAFQKARDLRNGKAALNAIAKVDHAVDDEATKYALALPVSRTGEARTPSVWSGLLFRPKPLRQKRDVPGAA